MVGGLLASGPLFDATPRRKPGRVTPPGVVKLPITNPRGHAKDDPSDCTKHSVWRRTSLTSVGVDEDHSSGSSLPSLSRIEVSRMAPFPTSGRHTGRGSGRLLSVPLSPLPVLQSVFGYILHRASC